MNSHRSTKHFSENLGAKLVSESHDVMNRKAKERKRNLLYLMANFLQEEGYLETAECLKDEAQLSSQFSICDNIDLPTILQEYESYFFLRYQKHPKICKLLPRSESIKEMKSSKPNPPRQKIKKSSSEESKSDDMSDLMCIQSLNKDNAPVPDPQPFKEALIPPSILACKELQELSENITRDIVSTSFDIKWEDVIGLQKAKEALQETLVLPLQYPDLFKGILAPWKSVLLYGPPGTGKTMLAKALASESRITFFNITATNVVSKWRGESEKLMRVLFETAKHQAPCVIFMDEFDALACRSTDDHEGNKRLMAEFLMQMDGINSSATENVFLLAVTNSPWLLQSSVLRRFEKRIYIDLPNTDERKKIIERFLPSTGHPQLEFDLDYDKISQITKGYSGSDLKTLCREAAMGVLRKALNEQENIFRKNGRPFNLKVTMDDMDRAILRIKPTTGNLQNKYRDWEKTHGSS